MTFTTSSITRDYQKYLDKYTIRLYNLNYPNCCKYCMCCNYIIYAIRYPDTDSQDQDTDED
jgi:hypothetical protein